MIILLKCGEGVYLQRKDNIGGESLEEGAAQADG
jgi:hypothetical protein